MKGRVIAAVALSLAGAESAQAGGFMIGEMSSRAAGMASAFTAVADDASAAWYNPAGVAFSPAGQLMVGGDVIMTRHNMTSNTSNPLHPTSASAANKTFVLPHGYYTYWDENSSIGSSISINSPFGLGTDWPTTAPFASKTTVSKLSMVLVNPSVVFRLSDRLSIAGGVDYAYSSNVTFDSMVQYMKAHGDGWGGNAAIFYKGDGFNVGVNYRSRINIGLKGVATAVPGSTFATLFGATGSSATSHFTLPDQVNVGVAMMPNDEWTVSLDVDWVNWKTYRSVDIAYNSAAYRGSVAALQTAVGATATGGTNIAQNWKATVAFRLGAEWKYIPTMRARFGYIYDPTPIRDVDFSPSVPGNDRHLITLGYGYDITPEATLDLGYAYVYITKRTQTQSPATPAGAPNSVKNGIYKGDAHIIMASLNYRY